MTMSSSSAGRSALAAGAVRLGFNRC
jgi:hypothetical protein